MITRYVSVVSTKQHIAEFVIERGSTTGRELRKRFDISAQALSVHLRDLIATGVIVKTGSTRGARYYAPDKAPPETTFRRRLDLAGLEEAEIYEHAAVLLNLKTKLKPNLETTVHYAFTEMLNNAIDHSESKTCLVELKLSGGTAEFVIRDYGIGVFESIASKLELEDEQAAMMELIKGKTTTMPSRHTGEGLFFTSKVADRFTLRSHRLEIRWDRFKNDVFVKQRRFLKGTEVGFLIRRDSRTRLEEIFSTFAPEQYDFSFDATSIRVKLLNTEYISRSEAKRLLANLAEKFKEVELNFQGVTTIGQGFADEVFRVFVRAHPELKITAINANAAVAAMIEHSRV